MGVLRMRTVLVDFGEGPSTSSEVTEVHSATLGPRCQELGLRNWASKKLRQNSCSVRPGGLTDVAYLVSSGSE